MPRASSSAFVAHAAQEPRRPCHPRAAESTAGGMTSARHIKILWGRSAGRCSFPDCRRELVEGEVIIGEMAHIIAASVAGPRGNVEMVDDQRHTHANLLLVCERHHKVIDAQPMSFPAERLRQVKADHEHWVETSLRIPNTAPITAAAQSVESPVNETVYSTLLPVVALPRYVYAVATEEREEASLRKRLQATGSYVPPFILRDARLITFDNLKVANGPFASCHNGRAERFSARTWWDDRDRYVWYVTLLNRCLNKITGRLGLELDRDHDRFYFPPGPSGAERSVTYRSISGRREERRVAGPPRVGRTEELKHYWEHLAVGLRFHRIAAEQWCLSIRPERRFTRDGYAPLSPKGTGRRATSRKAHMYNINVLQEVNFWRDFLSGGKPRLILRLDGQSVIVETALVHTQLRWPGVPGDATSFRGLYYDDDLFSAAEYRDALDQGEAHADERDQV
jgi:hypothetical protein